MSAFIVNDYHVARLVEYGERKDVRYYWNGQSNPIAGNGQRVFNVLIRANLDSVNYRYSENTPATPGEYEPAYDVVLGPAQVIKACHCLAYQSCETDDWEKSEAFAIINAIESTAIRRIPGYEEAEWEIAPKPINRNIRRIA